MTSLPRLGRADGQLVSELRKSLSAVVGSVAEEEQPAALERLLDWREEQLGQKAFGGSNA